MNGPGQRRPDIARLPRPALFAKISTCVGRLLPNVRSIMTFEFIPIKGPECAQNNDSENQVVTHFKKLPQRRRPQ